MSSKDTLWSNRVVSRFRGTSSQTQSQPSTIQSNDPPSPEYINKVSEGHSELLDFIHGKIPNPPSKIAPFYLGGARSNPELSEVSSIQSIANILYEHMKNSNDPSDHARAVLALDTEKGIRLVRKRYYLGTQTECECTEPFLFNHLITNLAYSLGKNDVEYCRSRLYELEETASEAWRDKLNCEKTRDCKLFSERCQDVTFDSQAMKTINNMGVEQFKGMCINMASSLIGHKYQLSSCERDLHYKEVDDPFHMDDLNTIHELQAQKYLTPLQAAELSERCDRRRKVWMENHTGMNSHHFNRIPREERVFD